MFDLKVVKTGLMAAAMVSGMALSTVASAALLNSSFEAPDASAGDQSTVADWISFNGSFVTSNNFMPGGSFVNPTALDGTQVLKLFGGDGGALQLKDANEGENWTASVNAINWAGDEFNNLFLLQLAFFDGGGGLLSATDTFADPFGTQAYDLQPQDGGEASDWTLMEVSAVAPEGTASAQILLIHLQITPDGGAIFLDEAGLEMSPIPLPAAVWLFGSALGLLGWAKRRRAA